jgi:hypothetical protein
MRRIYVTDDDAGVDEEVTRHWEVYRFVDEEAARAQWRAPVSPYFHVIDADGRVLAKGLGNLPEHLDRLLTIKPASFRQPDGPIVHRDEELEDAHS